MSADYVIIVQARRASVRLPDKVTRILCGQPMILQQLARLSRMKTRYKIVVATTATESDVPLIEMIEAAGYLCYAPRVRPEDVLGRMYETAKFVLESIDHPMLGIVRITGDCPLIDPDVVEEAIAIHRDTDARYVALDAEWPEGLDVEVMTYSLLETAHNKARLPVDREHVTPIIWRGDIDGRHDHVYLRCPLQAQRHKWSVDTLADLAFAREVYARLGTEFKWRDVLALLDQNDAAMIRHHATHNERNGGYLEQIGAKETWNQVRYGR